MTAPREKCPWCSQVVRAKRNGRLFLHRIPRAPYVSATPPRCPGSDKHPAGAEAKTKGLMP